MRFGGQVQRGVCGRLPGEQYDIVGQAARPEARQQAGIVPGRPRNATVGGIDDADICQRTLGRHAPQVHFQQCRKVSRITGVLEGVELVLEQQRELAQQAQLVRRADHDPTAGPGQAHQLAETSPWVLQMFDHLHGSNHVRFAIGQRHALAIQVHRTEGLVCREAIVADCVRTDIAVEEAAQVAPQIARTAADVKQ
jgi:hypothetical protein